MSSLLAQLFGLPNDIVDESRCSTTGCYRAVTYEVIDGATGLRVAGYCESCGDLLRGRSGQNQQGKESGRTP